VEEIGALVVLMVGQFHHAGNSALSSESSCTSHQPSGVPRTGEVVTVQILDTA
jgi:hypothetical protein